MRSCGEVEPAMTLTLTAMRGYPGSGKSTKAREIADKTGAVVVCRDDLRKMLHGVWFSGKKELEEQVTISERAQVASFLKAGVSVVVDATHLEPNFLRKWAKMAALYGAEFKRVDVLESPDECKRRDHARMIAGGRYVGDAVIERMAKRHPCRDWPNIQSPPVPEIVPVEWVEGLPAAIIVDIDGTVAHMAGRSPYDYSQVHTDTVDENVADLVRDIYDYRNNECCYPIYGDYTRVLFVSGRDDTCREATAKWLLDNLIRYDELHMRPAGAKDNHGNKLPDYVVKHDLFNQHIRGNYNVRFVLDDRDQVVNLWRALGLKCLQVQPGDF